MILNSFQSLGLAEPITRAIGEEGYTQPTPIQAAAVPPAVAGRDLIGIAQTGTGKTAAFALPILHRLANAPARPAAKSCRVLVLSPTRELSGQIADSFRTYGRHLRHSVALAIGGVPIGKQIRALANGVDIIVATPGRLMDLHRSRALKLDAVEVLVLDEADRMLDMGFIRDIRAVVALLPRQRQTLFFSATMPKEIVSLADSMLSNPVKVAVTPPATTVERIDQQVIHVDRNGKAGLLAEILGRNGIGRTLVFTRTKHGADKVVRALEKAGIPAAAIHGNKSQGQRERALASFRDGKTRTLIATDIAARGIDVDGITHVVNFDLPNVPETYVHRIGRTARAGNDGVAISFCSGDEAPLLRDIEKAIRRQIPAVHRGSQPGAAPVAERPRHQADRQPNRGEGERGNGRKQGKRNQENRRPGNRKAEKRGERGIGYNPGRSSDDISGVHFLKQSPDESRARSRAHRAV